MDLLKKYFKYFETYEILLFLFIFLLFIFGSLVFIDYKSNSKLLSYAFSYQQTLIDNIKKRIEDLNVEFVLNTEDIFYELQSNKNIDVENLVVLQKNKLILDTSSIFIPNMLKTFSNVGNEDIIFSKNIPYLVFHVKKNDFNFYKIIDLIETIKSLVPKDFNFVIKKGQDVYFLRDQFYDDNLYKKGNFIFKYNNKEYIVSESTVIGDTNLYILSDKLGYFRVLNKIERVSLIDIIIGFLFISTLILIRYYIGRFYYEREEIEQLFEIEHEKFESIVEAIGEGVALVDHNYKCIWANTLIKENLGEGEEHYCYSMIWDEIKPCVECTMEKVFETKNIQSFRKEINQGAKTFYYDVILSPLVDNEGKVIAVVELVRDITDIITLQLQVQQSENYLRNILENIPDAIITFDENYNILTRNKAALEIFGDEIQNCNIKDYVRDENLWEILKDQNLVENYDVYIEGEKSKPVRLSIIKLINDNRLHYLMIVRDMTKIRELESKLVEKEKLSALGLLAGGVAHEINNPLVGILNFAQLLDKKLPENSYEKKLVKTIIEASKDTKQIVNNLLAFARHKDSDVSNVDLKDSLDFAIKILGSKIRDKKVDVKVDIFCDTNVLANKGKLHQLIINLLSNAIDAVDENGKIDILFDKLEDKRVFKIKDYGKGIPEDVSQKIFDPFFTTKGLGKGTGLGLAIVKSIVDEYGWEIDVKSEVGKYSEFIIYI
ncbi:hypothetical protein DEFDS_1377 [Deferribacter desulfuricans SSM1]|uniref:histidine kinase n=1 Tax=Deferribacter desulfuricans (strain DSM 14783 / JCM 11476 / NBRC 101012 / SSM1) TaxID=639282 RepID=D3PE15_DEFDS|nr:ATP-binding protein [Deferribacter desulfuricans]BAI80838.1 hypothetical protein DEFDS_1377 [Deferribacter desulfuricans SSM1]